MKEWHWIRKGKKERSDRDGKIGFTEAVADETFCGIDSALVMPERLARLAWGGRRKLAPHVVEYMNATGGICADCEAVRTGDRRRKGGKS